MGYRTVYINEYLQNEHDIYINKVNDGADWMHAHAFIEFSYVEAGQGTHIIGDAKEPLEEGDIYIINTNVPHAYQIKNGEVTIYNCIFQPSTALDDSMQDISNFLGVAYSYIFHSLNAQPAEKGYIRLSAKREFVIGDLFREMYQEYQNKQHGYMQIMHANVKKLLVYMFRLYQDDNKQSHDARLYKKMIVQNTIQYLSNHYKQSIKCDDLSKQVYLSTGYLNRIFKESTGKTIITYLQEIRIEAACNLLLETDLSIDKIMVHCGYSDIKYFYDVFHKLTGQTPGQFRKKHKK